MALVSANDAEFYYELRGSGPPLLLMMGATGDGGVFDRFADLLADEFTVVTYDRRGNGRSPRPAGWLTTSPEEQADDAAALLDVLELAPAAVFGTSSGGVFALEMLIRHPRSVLGAVLHEPALVVLFDDPAQVRGIVTAAVEEGMRLGGRRLALERFVRLVAGDANWNGLDSSLRARMLSSADTYFDIEIGKFDTYLPDASALARIETPIQLVVSDGSLPYFAQATTRLASRLGVDVTPTSGTHFAYLDHPEELADSMKPFLRGLSSTNPAAPAQALTDSSASGSTARKTTDDSSLPTSPPVTGR